MANVILMIGTCALFGLLFIGYGHMVYIGIRDDIRHEKERKENLKKAELN